MKPLDEPSCIPAPGSHRVATPLRRWRWLVGMALTLAASSVYAQCSVSATGLEFAGYDVFSAAHNDSTATITVTCNEATEYRLALNSANGTSQQPRLSSSGDTLAYELHQHANRTTAWGEGSDSLSSSTEDTSEHTVYGRIKAQQNVRVGHYADTITVTLTF
ncbi:Csu type fimbrial protein [Halomonas sp. MA07-2]|uniref:Csu type fimbrial protein n=1 Tax=Halomonas sp. MA07-2 TaxID=3440841 RepID=UPI003EF02245